MVWISYGVFMRYVIGQPDRMVTEATALLLFPVALVGLAYAMREDSYPRVTLLTDAFSPFLQKLVALMNGAIMAFDRDVLFHHHRQRHDPGVQFRVVLGNPELASATCSGASRLSLSRCFTIYAMLRLVQIALRPAPEKGRARWNGMKSRLACWAC